jgi:hypothetical protein
MKFPMKFFSLLPLALGLLAWHGMARADDVYVIARGEVHPGRHEDQGMQLLQLALEASKPEYGPYQLSLSPTPLQHKRLLLEMVTGQTVNVSVQMTNKELEKNLTPIRIPVDKGLASFRISLIDGRRQDEFSRITSLPQLQQLAAGVGEQWTLRDVYAQNGLRIVTGSNYAGLFGMLMAKRFDYLPRSIEEALRELPEQEPSYPQMAIEQSFALYAPVPRYFFVSPTEPRLAKRLLAGMEKIIANGEFDRYFANYYGPMIAKAGLCKRTIFKMDDPDLSAETPLKRSQLWFDPFSAAGRKLACHGAKPAPEKIGAH